MTRERMKRLISECKPLLEKIAGRLARNRAERDDLLQDTYERALSRADQIDENTETAVGWLVTILRNRFIDLCREPEIRKPHGPIDDELLIAPPPEPASLWRVVSDEQVAGAIEELPRDLREAFVLFELDGLSQRAIALKLGITEANVATRVRRARDALKELLQQHGKK